MQDQVSVPAPTPQKPFPKIYILFGVVAVAVYVVAIGLIVRYKPEWFGGKPNAITQQRGSQTGENVANFPNAVPTTASVPIVTSTPTPTPPPQGPGQYACSAWGDCKEWDSQIQKVNCTVTYADRYCLNQCGDVSKRCKI